MTECIEKTMATAVGTQQILNTFTQEQIDRIVDAIAVVIKKHCTELAELAVNDTQIPRYQVWLQGKPGTNEFEARGFLRRHHSPDVEDSDPTSIKPPCRSTALFTIVLLLPVGPLLSLGCVWNARSVILGRLALRKRR